MKTKLLLSAMVMCSSLLMASECTLTKHGEPEILWTAFKTPAKVGVKGKFDGVALHGATEASSLKALLSGTKVSIDSAKVNSGNAGRDVKLVSFFFDVMSDKAIDAEVLKVDADSLLVAVTMNGIRKEVPMRYTYDAKTVEARGVIDLGDFNALAALAAITKACFALHQGKTWQDVEIGFRLDVNKQCK